MPLTKTFKETKVKEKLLFFLNLRSRGGKSYSIFELISIFKALSKWLYIIKIIVWKFLRLFLKIFEMVDHTFYLRIYETLWINIDQKYVKILHVVYETLPH